VSKESVDTYTCDLCHEKSEVPEGRFPVDWVKVGYEPVERTFAQKHVCGACVNQIKYPKEKK
jgi:hypothetical protein